MKDCCSQSAHVKANLELEILEKDDLTIVEIGQDVKTEQSGGC